jgi:hypothetical protein
MQFILHDVTTPATAVGPALLQRLMLTSSRLSDCAAIICTLQQLCVVPVIASSRLISRRASNVFPGSVHFYTRAVSHETVTYSSAITYFQDECKSEVYGLPRKWKCCNKQTCLILLDIILGFRMKNILTCLWSSKNVWVPFNIFN